MSGRLKIPAWLLIVDGVGTLLLALGILGLVSGGTVVPFLADRNAAWMLVATGGAMVAYFTFGIVRLAMARQRKAGPSPRGPSGR